ncbi:MAG: class I SAM-dependent methyltransferase [Proteobacteria bacterium]|nr:class I SAM-dependent methyltransferase [Pseudomonadota bacterium]
MSSDKFTGERPGWGKDFDYDEARHLAAYRHAAVLAEGKHVLDAGCGEGFGTRTLVDAAASVVGLDYSEQAIEQCRRAWGRPGLEFHRVDLTEPGSFTDTFDLVINFQVVEHIEDPRPFIEGLRARIAAGGCLLLTTPNRLTSFSENPYHVREYTADELTELLSGVFSSVEMSGTFGNQKVTDFDAGREKAVKRIMALDPLGLRKLLPSSLINFAFARLSVLVRRQARGNIDGAVAGGDGITIDDFSIGSHDMDKALDLVALCRP